MSFNNIVLKLNIILCVFILSACAAKKTLVEDPALVAERLKAKSESESFQQAIQLLQADDLSESALLEVKATLDALYESNSKNLGALINSADISFKLNKLDQAKASYIEVLAQLESQPIKQSDESKFKTSSIESSVNSHRFKIHAYNQLGLIERQQGQFDEAEQYYRQALALNNENATTIKNLAILLDLYRGQLAEAYVLYKQYQELVGDSDPKVKDWLFDLKNRLPPEESTDE